MTHKIVFLMFGIGMALAAPEPDLSRKHNPDSSPDATGLLQTYSADGPIDRTGPFFRPLGSNGRSCSSCHRPAQGWSISAEEVKLRFQLTKGSDPIFRDSDGANCDLYQGTSTIEGRRSAYGLLTDRGLIRIVLPVPVNREYEVAHVENSYGCGDRKMLSVYRRPLPVTNLRFLSTIMWDGRGSSPQVGTEPIASGTNPSDLIADLAHQASDAAHVHLQTVRPLTPQQQHSIVRLEMGLVTAQAVDSTAGDLEAGGAKGGPVILARETMQAFFVGINDSYSGDPHRIKAEDAIRLFDAWSLLPYGRLYRQEPPAKDPQTGRRASIARGQVLFNQKPFDIQGVAGLNDDLHLKSITGACGTCHNSPNAGNHSVAVLMNTGTANVTGPLEVSYLPAITLQNRFTGETALTTDPGYSLTTGEWKDIGKFKVPVLRGLAARPPYFHNGSAHTLGDVIDFYNKRFHVDFSSQEKEDLIAFLSAL